MIDVRQAIDEKGNGGFYVEGEGEQLGEMAVSVAGNVLTAYHTEVLPKAEGKGLGKRLLDAMVEYVRKHHLKVVPLCQYVHAQFRRHPAEYGDIWLRNAPGATQP